MPFNPSGVFQRLYRWVTDRDNSIPIDSTRMDAEMDGMVTGMNQIVNGTQAFTGTIKAPTGTVLTPAFTFSNDPDTGVYRSGLDTVGISAGGAAALTIGPGAVVSAKLVDMGGNQIINMGAGTAAPHAVRYDQAVLRDGTGAMTGPLQVPFGSEPLPGLQFGNTNNGIYWIGGAGPLFTAAGSTIGRLAGGTALSTADSIVTRQAGDARYAQSARTVTAGDGLTGGGDLSANRTFAVDASVVRTGAAQTISGIKTHTSNLALNAATATLVFDSDTSDRYLMTARQSGTAKFHHRMRANGDYELWAVDSSTLRIIAPMVVNAGGGEVFVEKHADDGDGTGLCFRASTNPTTGMIFSVRSNGGALGLGVQQDKVSVGRAEMYIGASNTGTGGNRVVHSGMTAGSVGELCLAKNKSGATTGFGATVAGSNLEPSSAAGTDITASLTGTWRCLGYAPNTGVTLFRRIS